MATGYKTGGRQKGSLNKDNADIRAMVIGALNQVGGAEYLAARAIDTPAAFLTLVGKILPTQVTGDPENPLRFVIRGPAPSESADQWLETYAPKTIDHTDVDTGDGK